MDSLPEPDRCKKHKIGWLTITTIIIFGVFFLGLFLVKKGPLSQYISQVAYYDTNSKEIFGFAPYWNLSKFDGIDWSVLTSFAYFSLPVMSDGSIDRYSYEWNVFEGKKLNNLFDKAGQEGVKKIVTFTQMEAPAIESFLDNPLAWEIFAKETVTILDEKNLDGVNIDIEYIPSSNYYRQKFSDFMETYTHLVKEKRAGSYITVSVLASSVKLNKIYDVGHLSRVTDGVMMMAYDFYYSGSPEAGPTAPLYGYNNGDGPYWYDVSTAVEDFLRVADSEKIILGVPYYGWNYPASSPAPLAVKSYGWTVATTNEKAQVENLIKVTPMGGWDDQAKVSWRGYYDTDGWHVVYLEDKRSLSYKYDFIQDKDLQGVGIWALGYDNGDPDLWDVLREKFNKIDSRLAYFEN